MGEVGGARISGLSPSLLKALLASVLFDRDIAPAVAAGKGDDEGDEEMVRRLAADAVVRDSEVPRTVGKFAIKTAANLLWRQGRMLAAISEELENRPKGQVHHRMLGKLPVVGMAALVSPIWMAF